MKQKWNITEKIKKKNLNAHELEKILLFIQKLNPRVRRWRVV